MISLIKSCGARAFDCICTEQQGHTTPHTCTRDNCNGQWTGDFESGDFVVVRFPGESIAFLLQVITRFLQ